MDRSGSWRERSEWTKEGSSWRFALAPRDNESIIERSNRIADAIVTGLENFARPTRFTPSSANPITTLNLDPEAACSELYDQLTSEPAGAVDLTGIVETPQGELAELPIGYLLLHPATEDPCFIERISLTIQHSVYESAPTIRHEHGQRRATDNRVMASLNHWRLRSFLDNINLDDTDPYETTRPNRQWKHGFRQPP